MEAFILALGQLLFGFVLACVGLFLFYVAPWVVIDGIRDRNERQRNQLPLYPFDKAELRTGGWQYYDEFFNKMEDFRSDFSGR